jgi:hypothetical protein
MDGMEAKVVLSFQIAADKLDSIGVGRKLTQSVGWEHAEKNNGSIRQHALQGNVLAGEIVPGQVRLFDEEGGVFIPTGDFHTKTFGTKKSLFGDHGNLCQNESRFLASAR